MRVGPAMTVWAARQGYTRANLTSPMRLSRFISVHAKEILAEWDAFARTLFPAATGMSALALRDHAEQMLEQLAKDIDTRQSAQQQAEKSKGSVSIEADVDSAASTHGTVRQYSGFTLVQLVAEFRALRATVLRLWLLHIVEVNEDVSYDMVRFNEAIDQALAESVVTFSDQTARARDTFLAILGHDLRSPLSAMALAGQYLKNAAVGTEPTRKVGARIVRSAAAMSSMVNDLLEYGRSQLGGEMPIKRRWLDLKEICQGARDDAAAAYPDHAFELQLLGELSGLFDGDRLKQVFSNLLNNAAQHGSSEKPILMVARGEREAVTVEVRNFGRVIPSESLRAIFDPLVQLAVQAPKEGQFSTSTGLGLFIAREITVGHGGTITAESSAQFGTLFSVRLPRAAAPG